MKKSRCLWLVAVCMLLAATGCGLQESTPLPTLESGMTAFHEGDQKKAKQIFERFAKQGDPVAQYHLALMAFDENDTFSQKVDQRQFDTALELLRRAAGSGHPDAMKRLGNHYESGWGVEADLFVAEDWYRKGRALSEKPKGKPTFVSLGADSRELPVDQVVEITRAKALSGDVNAIFAMSQFYENDLFIAADPKEAFRWYLEGAKHGSNASQFQVAYHYCRGLGVEKDVLKANELMKQSRLVGVCK